jgi:probable HAF family extracellular repeat protein
MPTDPSMAGDVVAPTAVVLSTGETYTINDLGTLGGAWSEAYGVNANGMVVGVSETTDGSQHAFVWTADGGMRDINGSDWRYSKAEGVNNHGMVVGWGIASDGVRGFVWTADGGMVNLGVPSLHTSSYAFNVNDAGEVVGMASSSSGFKAIVWRSPTNLTILGNLGGTASKALDINEDGRVAGKSTLSSSLSHGVVWIPLNPMVDLGTLGGNESEAFGINEISQVVGWAHDASQRKRPFLWPVGRDIVDLNTLGGDNGEAWEINDAGYAVGDSELSPGSVIMHATLWMPDGAPVDLGPLDGANESHARDINSTGAIVGYATTAAGNKHAVVWSVDGGGDPPPPPPPPPEVDPIDALIEMIYDLEDAGALKSGNVNALLSKLDAVQAKIDDGKEKAAMNILGAFQNQVRALVRSRKLTPEEARPLLDAAQELIRDLRDR